MLHMIVEAWPPGGHEPRSDDIKVKAGVAGCWVACYSTFINRRRDMSSQFRAGAGESSDWVNPSSVDDAPPLLCEHPHLSSAGTEGC